MAPESLNTLVSRTKDSVTVAVRISSKARSPRIDEPAKVAENHYSLKRGNGAVITLLAKSKRDPRSNITVQSGATSRRKTLRIKSNISALRQRIKASMTGSHDG